MAPRIKTVITEIDPTIPSKEVLGKLMRKVKAETAVMQEAKGTLGNAIEQAVADHNLHLDAFRIVKKYFLSKSPEQQSEFMFHLPLYWEHLGMGHPNKDLVETPAERKTRGRPRKHPEMKGALTPEGERLLGAGTHVIKNGKLIPIEEGSEAA